MTSLRELQPSKLKLFVKLSSIHFPSFVVFSAIVFVISTLSRFSQYSKAFKIFFRLFGKATAFIFVWLKAPCPISSIPSGSTSSSSGAEEKAHTPIFFIDFGSVMCFRAVESKVLSFISVIPSGILHSSRLLQFSNALSPISLTLSGILTAFKCSQ